MVLHAVLSSVPSPDSYALRMLAAVERAGGPSITVHRLPGPHPQVDPSAILAAELLTPRLPDGAVVLVDALALPNLAAALAVEDRRLRLVALVDRLRWADAGDGGDGDTNGAAAARRHLEQGVLALMRMIVVPDRAVADAVIALGLPSAILLRVEDDEPGGRALVERLEVLAGALALSGAD
ncbi:glycosyl transferase [Azospirillum griseum]|uniref:glycosyl transferase n=1 Tax=Azospirillum griseum TaxID=2496639 RepID=UPI001AECE06D|nr:glycosyl transferase [Azospirillum griseum]